MIGAMRRTALSVAFLALLVIAPRAQSPDAGIRGLVEGPKFKQAAAFIQGDQARFVRELVALTEIPAPPFKEQARGKAFMDMLRNVGTPVVQGAGPVVRLSAGHL
jgi:hypothetical protein